MAFFLSLEGVQRRGMILPSRQVHDAGEFTGALVGVGTGDATRLSSTPSTRTPAKRAE